MTSQVLRYAFLKGLFWCVALLPTLAVSSAYAVGPYDRIEEDWELIVGTPDKVTGSPQIALEMKPEAGSAFTGIFLINYRDTPDFLIGGVQVQLWENDVCRHEMDYRSNALGNVGEKIPFTLYLDRQNGSQLKFGVSKGKCQTWGDLGGGAPLDVMCIDPSTTFTTYDSNNSKLAAQIVAGETRVTSLKLLQVRKYYANKKGFDTETGSTVYP